MTPFRYRLLQSDGDIRYRFWSLYLVRKRLGRGQDSAGRKLVPARVGSLLF